MKTLTNAQLTAIANEVLATSVEVAQTPTLKRIVRQLLIEAMQAALKAAGEE